MSLTETTTRHLADHASRLTGRTPTIEVTEQLADSVRHDRRDIVAIQPPKESDGINAGTDLVSALYHNPSILGESHTFSFTPTYSAGRITIYASAPGGRAADIRDAVTNYYPGASVRAVPDADGGIPLPAGHYAAGAKLTTAKLSLYPLRTTYSNDPLESDPHTAFLPQLVGDNDETACIQAVFRPVRRSWYNGGLFTTSGETIEEGLQKGKSTGWLNPRIVTTASSKRAAKDVSRQQGRDAFEVSLRILTVAPTREAASQRARDIAANLNGVHNPDTGQELVPDYKAGGDLRSLAQAVAGRWPDVRPRPWRALFGCKTGLTDHELGDILVHFPTKEDVQAPLEWSEQTESERIPADAY